MFKTKKEVDIHVRTALAKLRSETEKNLRSFTIAKLYYKINEYSTAEQYVSSYLTIKDDNDQAYKLLGQCYQRQKKPEKALESFQRSLQLNPKQPDLLADVCQLLIEDKALNTNKAKYWCDLAESEKVQHDAVFSLRLKLMNKDNLETNQVEQLIQKEISSRPQDVNLRVRLVRHFIEQNKILEAFQNACHLEMINHNMLAQSAEWYNVVWLVLSKYEQIPNTNKDWEFWLLLITCLERQVNISFTANTNLPNGGTTDTANLLFNFDQYLYKLTQISDTLNQQKELVSRFMDHYQGQLCLHAASLIFKRELIQNKNKWKETIKTALPLLLLAYQSDKPDSKEPWMKHCDASGKLLIQLWNREGAFRCAQAGRTLLACIEENNENSNELNNIMGNASPWKSPEALISQIRQCCSDKNWRRAIFGQLFCNSDQKVKETTSLLIKSTKLSEPNFEMPTYAEVEQHEETAQYLKPQSLQHMVYLCLGNENLSYFRAKFFSGLNFSTQNLSFCGAESLNQLDIETFLYAATLQAKRLLDIERKTYVSYNAGTVPKPKVLPFVNIQYSLCTEEQMNWWTSAYQVYKNLTSDNLAEIRSNLQYGIEAVRGINGPKIDMIIVFKLGNIFQARAVDVVKPIEKGMLDARAENLYKYGLNMLKMSSKGVLEPFKRYFKYANSNSSSVEREVSTLAEEAVSYLASRYFKKSEYEELIDELAGVQLPFATYLQSEAYRKLDEANKTPKKAKRVYLDKASECLHQTLQLLKGSHVDPNHPLNSVINSELKRLQQSTNKFMVDHNHGNNSSSYEDAETEFGIGDTSILYNGNNRSRREVSFTSTRQVELENLIKQIASMLTCVKEELVENIKPEVVGLKKDVAVLKEKLAIIEEKMSKNSNPPSPDDASNVLDDLYIIENELQNQIYSNQQQQQQQQQLPLYGSTYNQPHSLAPRMPTPVTPAMPGAVNPFSSPLYGNYAMNYYAQQFMMPPQQGAAAPMISGHPSQLANRNALNLPYVDPTMNFNMPGLNPPPLLPTTPDNRSANILGLLTQNQSQAPQSVVTPVLPTGPLPTKTFPVQQPESVPQTILPSITAPPPNPIIFNKCINNMPVEKGPPVNVVITSSDPLPISSAGLQTQPTLSVTIPSHHIKGNLPAANDKSSAPPPNVNFSMIPPPTTTSSAFTMKYPTPTVTTTTASILSFSFKPPQQTNPDGNLNKTNDSNTSDLHKSETEVEYDPRPDFKPIIPLPDEIEVRTGEENEEVMFCSRSRLYRYVDKEWKERGIGDIKILKNKENGTSRILMRRDQTHKICANHRITSELSLTKPKTGERGFIWAANDFADEELKLEKFFVRFKHAETAEKFQTAFNVACDEAKKLAKTTNGDLVSKPNPFGVNLPKSFADNKTSTPAGKGESVRSSFGTTVPTTVSTSLPKSLFDGLSSKTGNETNKPQTMSPFASFSFDKNTTTASSGSESKPFANIFASINNLQAAEPSPIGVIKPTGVDLKADNNKNSDNEDEYVPTAQFQPVIPLPDLVEVITGEEDEIVLFEHRAGLLRFDKTTTEWKERGVGNIKILQDKNDVNKMRLVMRRDTIHKLCCNQRLYKDTAFKYSKTSKNALVWAGQDYSENELQVETLSIRFKTSDTCKQFLDTIIQAQGKMSSAAKEENAKSEQKANDKGIAPAVTEQKGFGELFKPKVGSWECKMCYISNSSDKTQCAACKAPKDGTVPQKEQGSSFTGATSTTPAFRFGFQEAAAAKAFVANEASESAKQQGQNKTQAPPASVVGFGDKFKPKEGSWACKQCYLNNMSDKTHCASCEAPKDDTVAKKEIKPSFVATSGKAEFNFGFTGLTKSNADSAVTSTTVGFGDKFKPKEGSWSCSECYLSNTGDLLYCKACDAPKDNTVPKKESKDILTLSNPSQKFNFGFAAAGNAAVPKTEASSFIFGSSADPAKSTTAGGFTFGIPKSNDSGANEVTNIFGGSGVNTGALNLSTSKPGETKPFTFASVVAAPPESTISSGPLTKSTFSFNLPSKALEPTPDKGALGSAFSLDKKDFNFVLKPKSPGKGKSPLKVPNSPGGCDVDDEEECAEEEENNTYFTPVIPLPDKIEIKTGEEDEDILYCHRAKLYRFTDAEWKERGVGDVKILRHKFTKKLRVVMRREKILKICLNHVLNEDVVYKKKDDKSWLFVVNDYSEGEVELNQFSLRFKNDEVAEGFMRAVQDSLEGKAEPIKDPIVDKTNSDTITSNQPSKEVNISEEEKKIADKLMLPYSFFEVDPLASCPGCRGCNPDKFIFPIISPSAVTEEEPLPLDIKSVSIVKPNRSILKPSKILEELTSSNSLSSPADVTPVNNSIPKPATIQANNNSITTFSFSQALNSTTKNEEKQPAAVEGFLFGGSTGSSTFGGPTGDKSRFANSSIFGGSGKTVFGGGGAPLFGSGTNINSQSNFFGGSSVFGGQQDTTKSIFGGSVFGTKPAAVKDDSSTTKEKPQGGFTGLSTENSSLFAADESNLSFGALAAKQPQLDILRTTTGPAPSSGFIGLTNTNAFSNFKNANISNNDSAKQDDNVDAESGEHDPYFEPIIPLPAEISLSTGEEDEEKLYGDRGTLYRYDPVNKEWKERGVGEIKILQHKTKGTYRMIMRREQIHKLVLNHAIGSDLIFSPMGNNMRSFVWVTMNFAEDPAAVERLSVRFRTVDAASRFKDTMNKCIETAKSRSGLEHEQD